MNPVGKREESQDKLGTMPIGRLLVTMSVPMMISMFIQALYNVVDSMFVARLSEDALTAVSMAFPVQNIMIALAVGTGVGVNALVSRSLGEGNLRRAEKAANVQIFLDVCYAVLSLVAGLFFARVEGEFDIVDIRHGACHVVQPYDVFALDKVNGSDRNSGERSVICVRGIRPAVRGAAVGKVRSVYGNAERGVGEGHIRHINIAAAPRGAGSREYEFRGARRRSVDSEYNGVARTCETAYALAAARLSRIAYEFA